MHDVGALLFTEAMVRLACKCGINYVVSPRNLRVPLGTLQTSGNPESG